MISFLNFIFDLLGRFYVFQPIVRSITSNFFSGTIPINETEVARKFKIQKFK